MVLPGVPPVTSPFESTVAIAASAVVHVNVLSASGRPSAPRAVGVIWTLRVEMTTAGSGITSTDTTSVTTVIGAEPMRPSDVAVIVVSPGDTPVTLPLVLTEATVASALPQVTVRPVKTLPAASSVVGVICTLVPTTTLGCAAETVTVATAAAGGEPPPPGSLLLEQPRAKLTTRASRQSPERAAIGTSQSHRC